VKNTNSLKIFIWENEKTPSKHNANNNKKTASVLLKLFIKGDEICHTTATLAHEQTLFSNVNNTSPRSYIIKITPIQWIMIIYCGIFWMTFIKERQRENIKLTYSTNFGTQSRVKGNQYSLHSLMPVADTPSWVNGKRRMAVEIVL